MSKRSKAEFERLAEKAVCDQVSLSKYLGTIGHFLDKVLYNQQLAMDARLQLKQELRELQLRVLELEQRDDT